MTLERTCYSRAACPGGPVTLVYSVRGDTGHGGTGNTPTASPPACYFEDPAKFSLFIIDHMNTAQNLQMFDIYAQQSTARPKRLFPFYNDTLTSRKLALDSLSSTECNEHA